MGIMYNKSRDTHMYVFGHVCVLPAVPNQGCDRKFEALWLLYKMMWSFLVYI